MKPKVSGCDGSTGVRGAFPTAISRKASHPTLLISDCLSLVRLRWSVCYLKKTGLYQAANAAWIIGEVCGLMRIITSRTIFPRFFRCARGCVTSKMSSSKTINTFCSTNSSSIQLLVIPYPKRNTYWTGLNCNELVILTRAEHLWGSRRNDEDSFR